MNQNRSWESLIFVHILEEMKTQRTHTQKQEPGSGLIIVLFGSKEASQGGQCPGPQGRELSRVRASSGLAADLKWSETSLSHLHALVFSFK